MLTHLFRFSIIRFMQWMGTNNNSDIDWNDTTASDDYVLQLARLMLKQLKSDVHMSHCTKAMTHPSQSKFEIWMKPISSCRAGCFKYITKFSDLKDKI